MSVVTPLTESRASRQGKIKWAEKGPNGYPKRLDHYRLTSPDLPSLEALAAKYGGTPRPWDDATASERNQYELYTTTKELDVWIVPGQMTKGYEHWQGGVCVRRCDGEHCTIPQESAEGVEHVDVACLCHTAQELTCKPKVRASFILPDAPLAGTWMMESSGWETWRSLPELANTLELLQQGNRQLQPAKLVLVEKSKKVKVKQKGGGMKTQTNRWNEPKLVLPVTPLQIIAGEAGVQLGAPGTERVSIEVDSKPAALLSENNVIEMDERGNATNVEITEVIEDAQVVDDGPWPSMKAAVQATGEPSSRFVKEAPQRWVRKAQE